MELYADSDRPSLDISVERRLRRLDPNLRLTWTKWSIDLLTSRPVLYKGNPIPELAPVWHLWSKGGDGRFHHVRSYEHFGHKQCLSLEADCARWMTPTEILAEHRRGVAAREEKRRERYQKYREDFQKANKSRMHDYIFEDKQGRRQARAVSYAGQGSKRTPGEIQLYGAEDGWERAETPDDY